MGKILNPVCSEAVFRIGGESIRLKTDSFPEEGFERFVKALKKASETDLRRCKVVEDGGADLDLLWKLVRLRKDLGKETFAKITSIDLWEIEEKVIVIGKHLHIVDRPGEFFSALLEEGPSARVSFGRYVRVETLRKINSLFERWKRGEIKREEFRAEALSCCFEGKEL
jgi:hypothetical protein